MFINCTHEIIGYETENNFHRLVIMCLKFGSIIGSTKKKKKHKKIWSIFLDSEFSRISDKYF